MLHSTGVKSLSTAYLAIVINLISSLLFNILMIRKPIFFLLLFVVLCSEAKSQSRWAWSINDNWKYLPNGADFAQTPKANDEKWELVNLPHTWNNKDPFDDDGTSRRGISWYRKTIKLDNRFKGKQLYV